MKVVVGALLAFGWHRVHTWELGDPSVEFSSEWQQTYAEEATDSPVPRELGSISNFQPPMPFPSTTTALGCPHADSSLTPWDASGLQWPGRSGTGPPSADGSSIELPAGTAIIVRAGMLVGTASSPYGRITVPAGSRLVFDDTGATGDPITMDTLGLQIDGAVEAGSPTCRLEGRVIITLHGAYGSSEASDRWLAATATSDELVKGVVVTNTSGARLDLHGKLFHPTWTRLAAHVPGSVQAATSAPRSRNTVLFLQDCVNW